MRNLKLTLRYDGSDFAGWQTQPGRRTVQQTLEEAIARITNASRVRCNASGRTDAGVHAVGQVVNFYSATRIPTERLARAINSQLPSDVSVTECVEVPESFCANKSALRKLYRFVIHDGATPDPFLRKYAYFLGRRLDTTRMNEAGRAFIGRHDFRSFETHWPNRQSSIRNINHLHVGRFGDCVILDVEADGFLYNMVRAIAGTLINFGLGFSEPQHAYRILTAHDRTQAGHTAPPHGLFLMKVTYPHTVGSVARGTEGVELDTSIPI